MNTENQESGAFDVDALKSEGFSDEEITEITAEPAAQEPPVADAGTEGEGEPAAEGEAEKEGEKNPASDPNRPDGFVPLAALKESRANAKRLEEEVRQFRQYATEINQKLAAQQQVQQPNQNELPNKDEDPFGYTDGKLSSLEERLAAFEKHQQQSQQAQQVERQWQQLEQSAANEFNAQAAEDPEYNDAGQFVEAALQHEWQHLYSNRVPYEQYKQMVYRQNIQYARQNQIPIGEWIKQLATTRGWHPGLRAEYEARQKQEQTQQPDEKVKAAEEKIDKLAQAQAANMTLGKGASGGSGEPSLASIAKMSGEELERLASTNPELFNKIAQMSD